tara:strand:+ start:420 stop:887 length:468 start_codon:yes stop_codon:yes gene_type:complete
VKMIETKTPLDAAISQLGFIERANNDTMYGKWYGMNFNPWCAMFISWCFTQGGQPKKVAASGKKGFASCDAGLKWFAKRNKIIPIGQAKAGDIAFFQFNKDAQPDHVGLVVKNNGKYLWCIEGNTSSNKKGSQSNGDGVFKKKRHYSLIMGVVRP